MVDNVNGKVAVGNTVRLIGKPFDKTEAMVSAVDADGTIGVTFEFAGDLRTWVAKTGEYIVVTNTPAPTVVIPKGLRFDPDGWEDRGFHAIATRIDNGVYKNKVDYLGYQESKLAAKASVRAWRDAYHKESNDLMVLFKNDLLVAYELDNHPAVGFWNKLVDKAWNDGHSDGFGNILHTFDNLMDVFDGYDVVVGGRK